MFSFAVASGDSLRDKIRLFYHAGLKRAFAFRGLTRYSPEKIISFKFRIPGKSAFTIYARDDGMDVGSIEEFFSARNAVIPSEALPYEPQLVYDIGANIGASSLYLATHYAKTRFYAFEPLPSNQKVCELNFRNLPGSRVFPWAVGARTETVRFQYDERDSRGGRIDGSLYPDQRQLPREIDVPLFSVDDLVRLNKLEPPDFLKIDVEGAELGVLEGIGGQINAIKCMILETHGSELTRKCLAWLKEHGFTIRHHRESPPGFAYIWCDRM